MTMIVVGYVLIFWPTTSRVSCVALNPLIPCDPLCAGWKGFARRLLY